MRTSVRMVLTPTQKGALAEAAFVFHGRASRSRCIYRCPEEVEAIGLYCAEIDVCYFVPIGLAAGRRGIHLRLAPCRNNQKQAINWASQYELGAIAQLGERGAGSAEVAGSSPASSTPSKPTLGSVSSFQEDVAAEVMPM